MNSSFIIIIIAVILEFGDADINSSLHLIIHEGS